MSFSTLLFYLPLGLFLVAPLARAQVSPPSSLKVEAASAGNQVKLSWPAVAGATGYKVTRAESLAGTATTLAANDSATNFSDSTAVAGTRYHYSVRALQGALESKPRNLWAAPSVIVDNAPAGGSGAGIAFTGSWAVSALAGSHGNASLYASPVAGSSPTATYTFTPVVPMRGLYDVYLRWTADPGRATNTPVDLVLADETRTFALNQEVSGGQWNLIATVPCEAGSTMSVVIRNNGANGYVIADGVQLVPRLAPWAPAAENTRDFTITQLTEDFDGTALDSAVWSTFAGRSNHSVSGGHLRTRLSYVGSVPIASATSADLKNESNWSEGGITSRHGQKFGYHEARIRLPQAPATGVDVAYWHGALDEYLHGYEIDAPEFFHSRTDPALNGYGFGVWDHFTGERTWDHGGKFPVLGNVTKYVTIGLEWRTDNSQVVYINGEKMFTAPPSGMNDTTSIQGSSIILSTKVLDWLNPNAALDGQEALWDYVRYYQKPGWLGTVDGSWDNPANWGPDGLPAPGFGAVFNVPTAPAAVSLSTDQTLQSLYLDGAALPAHTFSGPGRLVLGAGKPGDTSCTHGGIAVNTNVTVAQTFHTAIVGAQNLQFSNHSRTPGVALRLNGQISGDGVSPRDVDFLTPIASDAALGTIVLGQPLGPGIRHVHKAGDTPFTLPAGSQHDGELRIARGPVTIPNLSSLGTNATAAVLFFPRYLHSDSWRPRLTYTGPAGTSSRPIRLDGRFPDGILEANGTGPLTWTGHVVFGTGGSPSSVRSSNPRLTLGATSASGENVFAGNISDTDVVTSITNPDGSTGTAPAKLSLIKTGSGAWVLTGANELSSSLNVSQGKLIVGAGTSGSLSLTAPAGISVGSTGEIGFGRDDAVAFDKVISGAGALRKRGAGTLTLGGNHTFTGNATVEAGLLHLTGSLARGGTLTVGANGTLGGVGSSAKNVSITGTLLASPLTFSGTLAHGGASRLRATFEGNSAAGVGTIAAGSVSVSNGAKVDVVLNAAGSTVNFLHNHWRSARTMPLLTTTSRSGSFALGTVSNDSAGNAAATYGRFTLEHTATAVNLVWTPTPGFPSIDYPTLTITSPAAETVALPDLADSLRLTAVAGGNASVTWSLVSGPGSATFANAGASDTSVSFSLAGRYVLRATAANALGSVTDDHTVDVAPPASITLRQGVNGYKHDATFIRADSTSWNSGARDQMLVGRSSAAFRSLLSFGLETLPTTYGINGAQLDVWTDAAGSGTIQAVELRSLGRGFTEGTGNGSSSTNGVGTGADWLTCDGSAEWGSGGGDFDGTVLSSVPGFNAATTLNVRQTFASSPALVSAVGSALASGSPLNLMLLSPLTETAGGANFVRLASDDHGSSGRRPQLSITFDHAFVPALSLGTAPAATTGAGIALGGAAANATNSSWSLVSGPGPVWFTQPTSAKFGAPGTYLLRFSAANANGENSRDLTVAVTGAALSPLEMWRQNNFGDHTSSGAGLDTADPDSDGLANLLEYATGMNPNAINKSPVSTRAAGAVLEFNYTRSKAALLNGVTFQVQASSGLASGTWSAAGVSPETILSDNGTTQTVKVTIPLLNNQRFLRLSVTSP